MRRHLLLVRHAKSAWDDPALDDHDRPLAPRGAQALPRMADHLAAAGTSADVVLCSSARRAVDTWDGIRGAVGAPHVEIEDRLYAAGVGALLARLRSLPDELRCAVLVGHNPGLQDLAVVLVGSGDPDAWRQLAAKLPTGAIATLSFERPWAELIGGSVRIDDLFMPRAPRS